MASMDIKAPYQVEFEFNNPVYSVPSSETVQLWSLPAFKEGQYFHRIILAEKQTLEIYEITNVEYIYKSVHIELEHKTSRHFSMKLTLQKKP